MKRSSELIYQNFASIPLLSIEPHFDEVNTCRTQIEGTTYTNNEEHTSKHSGGHGTQYGEKRTGHGTPYGHAHQEVTDALFDNSCSLDKWLSNLIAILRFDNIETSLVDSQ